MARSRKKSRRKPRGRGSRKGFDTNTFIDVALADVSTDILPALLAKFLPIPVSETMYSIVGAGATWVAGMLLKKPVMQTAGLALGATSLLKPMISGIVGGGTPGSLPTGMVNTKFLPAGINVPVKAINFADPIVLNDFQYMAYPRRRSYSDYANGY